jgi:hypothetical protein
VLRLVAILASALAFVPVTAAPAHADHPPVTNRNYAIDLYDGVALGSGTIVGMGGAGAANVNGTPGVLLNPAAVAVRLTTDNDSWGLDGHVDFLTGIFATDSDYDNNGQAEPGGALILTVGFGGRIHDWAIALTATGASVPLGGTADLSARTVRARFSLARWFPGYDLALGIGVQTAQFQLAPSSGDALFSISGATGIAGASWAPHMSDVRLAAAFDGPIDGGQVETDSCDPDNCNGYILPAHVRAPWRALGGIAYRWSGSAWNQQVRGPYRDERALTLAADAVVTGATAQGYGLQAFAAHELQRSGRHTAISLRGGAEFEWIPGRLRLRAGSYWEPARFDAVSGRLHGTFGVDLRVLSFELWGPRRGLISFLADFASRYRNVGLGVGLWH